MKKIKEQEKKEQQQAPEMKLAKQPEVVSSMSSFLLNAPFIAEDPENDYFVTDSGSPVDQPSSIFHPPGA